MAETTTKERKTFSVDFKVYEKANIYEIPFPLPEKASDSQSLLKLGYQNIVVFWDTDLFEEFIKWCHNHGSILKVLDYEKLD
jgi:hypothetical protein